MAMTRKEVLDWFEDLVKRSEQVEREHDSYGLGRYIEKSARQWITEAGSALAAVFPEKHPCRPDWDQIWNLLGIRGTNYGFDELVGIFKGAANLVRGGRIGTLIEAIRVESESDLLEQAEALLEKDYLAASTVIAGGALESHLKHLCDRHGLSGSLRGSISAYN